MKGPVFSPKRIRGQSRSKSHKNNISITENNTTVSIKKTQQVFKYNLSLEHQHVKSSFMETSAKVQQLREAAQEKRESIRMKKSQSQERLGMIPEVKPKKVSLENSVVINRLLADTKRRQVLKSKKTRNPAVTANNSSKTAKRNLKKFLNC